MIQTSIISQDLNAITVQMPLRRWNHIRRLEETYRLAQAIRRGMRQAEEAPALTMDEAINELRDL